VRDEAGHFGGSMDAVALGIPEAPKTWHLCEFKTHNAKSFADLQKARRHAEQARAFRTDASIHAPRGA
jgi:hypothetical protein